MKKELDIISKRYGEGIVTSLADTPDEIEVISSGVSSLDLALKIVDARTGQIMARTNGAPVLGGYPRGRVTELSGPDSGGKTTLSLAHSAEVLKIGGNVVFIDVENKIQPNYAKAVLTNSGAELDNISIISPPHAEAVWETVRELVGVVDLIVIDSIAEMMTMARRDTDVGENQPGMLARIVKDGLYKSKIGTSKTILLVINQVRENIGSYGSYERTPGGRALKHKASVRIRISRFGQPFKEPGGREAGIQVRAKVKKNQIGIPEAETDFKLYWGLGIDSVGELVNTAKGIGLIQRAGGWYWLDYPNSLGVDEDNKSRESDIIESIRKDKGARAELEQAISDFIGG